VVEGVQSLWVCSQVMSRLCLGQSGVGEFWGDWWQGYSCLRWPLVVGKYLKVFGQGKLGQVLMASLAGYLPRGRADEGWRAVVGGKLGIGWIGCVVWGVAGRGRVPVSGSEG